MRGAIAQPNSPWWALKLANLSTILREWAAVHCVAHMSLREVLLTAKVGRALGWLWEVVWVVSGRDAACVWRTVGVRGLSIQGRQRGH